MKGYIQFFIILFLFCSGLLNAMEESEENSSPTSSVMSTDKESPEPEHQRSPASSMSSGTEAADFSRDIIATNRVLFSNLLQREFAKEYSNEDTIQKIIDIGLSLYNKDIGRYTILATVPQTVEGAAEAKQCFAQLKSEILSQLDRTSQSTIRASSAPTDKKRWPKNMLISAAVGAAGVVCFVVGAVVVVTAWQLTTRVME